jgi:hypothetical protein
VPAACNAHLPVLIVGKKLVLHALARMDLDNLQTVCARAAIIPTYRKPSTVLVYFGAFYGNMIQRDI